MPFTTGEDDLLQLNRHDFDFSVQFEQLFFSIIPSVLFVVVSFWRTLSQARKPTVVHAPVFQLTKVVITAPRSLCSSSKCAGHRRSVLTQRNGCCRLPFYHMSDLNSRSSSSLPVDPCT